MFISYALNYLPILLPWSLDTVFVTSILLYAGFEWKNFQYMGGKVMLGCIASCMGIYYLNGDVNLSVRNYGMSIPLCVIWSLIGSIIVMELSKQLDKMSKSVTKPLQYIGQNSLVIFTLQILFIEIGGEIMSSLIHNLGEGFVQGLLIVCAQFGIALIGGLISSKILKSACPSIFK